MTSRQQGGGGAERQAQVVYVVGERGGPAQLIDAERPGPQLFSEAAALMHELADRVEALKRGLRR